MENTDFIINELNLELKNLPVEILHFLAAEV